MSTNKPPFDKQMLLAVFAAMALWMGWQAYLSKKYPNMGKKSAATAPATAPTEAVTDANTTTTSNVGDAKKDVPGRPAQTAPPEASALETRAESKLKFQNDVWSFNVSSKGMSIKDITLGKYTDRNEKSIQFDSAEEGLFGTNLVGRARDLDFEISHPQDNQFFGEARIGATRILKTITVDSARYSFKTQIRVENPGDNFVGVVTHVSDHVKEAAKSFFLLPQHELQEMYVGYDNTNERTHITLKEAVSKNYSKVHVASLASQYFTVAVKDDSKVMPEYRGTTEMRGDREYIFGTFTHTRPSNSANWSVEYTGFAGPKSYRLLDSVDPAMASIVNFGFFQAIAKVIFRVLEFMHSVSGNWGFAIILLTLLVRILVLPFNLMSYRSMKGMAKIQPEMKVLREKYKADPTKLNQEMLKLMKEAKANPIGGCLPMLLQIPVFFALYQVLGQSIELYKAPFIFWIQDLSFRDPWFVLPVLMGVTLFLQQKITPSTLEPAQQKVMMFLPVIFSLFMITLPSGLTLYIFVSGLFAVCQQYYFMSSDRKKEAKA